MTNKVPILKPELIVGAVESDPVINFDPPSLLKTLDH